MRIKYIYNSGFVIETEKINILVDFYKDSKDKYVDRILLKLQKPLYILSSHSHHDHYTPEILTWNESYEGKITYILSDDIKIKQNQSNALSISYLSKGKHFADDNLRIYAFGSTDQGISFVIEIEGKILFHAGDLNNWHWKEEADEAYVAAAEKSYAEELALIREKVKDNVLDAAMLPVDPRLGKDHSIGARQFLSLIPTKNILPMHFRKDSHIAARFAPYAAKYNCNFVAPEQDLVL